MSGIQGIWSRSRYNNKAESFFYSKLSKVNRLLFPVGQAMSRTANVVVSQSHDTCHRARWGTDYSYSDKDGFWVGCQSYISTPYAWCSFTTFKLPKNWKIEKQTFLTPICQRDSQQCVLESNEPFATAAFPIYGKLLSANKWTSWMVLGVLSVRRQPHKNLGGTERSRTSITPWNRITHKQTARTSKTLTSVVVLRYDLSVATASWLTRPNTRTLSSEQILEMGNCQCTWP